MISIAIIYHSVDDHTHALATTIAEGIHAGDAEPVVYRIEPDMIENGRFVDDKVFEKLKDVDAIIFGAPTYMGGPSAQFKAFADASSPTWERQDWRGKYAAGFTVGTYPGGDQPQTLQYFQTLASQHDMLWLSLGRANIGVEKINPSGTSLGVTAHTPEDDQPNEACLQTAFYLGQHMVRALKGVWHT
ncbi:hypothetical protein BZG25_03815 [Salinivibrio sp. ML198]|uniref:flavodoxin family protein n=1 Tax=unclassified Salinivibrio TaxID=2636825 RepID=UPI000987737E|nr:MULTISPECIES: flavodoxin family protein [unclassified Salinivibrio]OOE66936.1 hypothetical protein BZG20_08785 [Salinivibrio sp. IB868]OOE71266.1 hypothetical protein BZG22_15030 [Salinivibrio sp. IB870]OOE81250.1 hypothetical protein BZG25_03815 [Salinivibrio sp. ML198]